MSLHNFLIDRQDLGNLTAKICSVFRDLPRCICARFLSQFTQLIFKTLFTVIRQMAKIITVSCKSHQLIDTVILILILTRWLIFSNKTCCLSLDPSQCHK